MVEVQVGRFSAKGWRGGMAALLTAALPGIVLAQEAPKPQPPATQPPATTPLPVTQPPIPSLPPAQQPGQTPAQPSGKTPSTPLPKEQPKSETYGISSKDVKPTETFKGQTPGQPLPGDPAAIRTIDDALNIAYQRSPSLLLAEERAYRTTRTVRQILGSNGPQITVSGGYTRLSSTGAAFNGGGTGVNPASIANPFGVGLTNPAPGTNPVTLSTNTNISAATPAGGANQQGTSTVNANTAGTSRAARSGTTRQTDGDGNGDGDGNNGGNNGGNSGGGITNNSADLNQYVARISISQLIDITGIVRTAVQIGRLEEGVTRLDIVRTRMDVRFNVMNAYYNLLRTQEFVLVNEAAVAQSQELLRVTQVQKNAGTASEFDVLRAQTQLSNNQQALISSRNQVIIAKNALANTLGIDPSTPIDPTVPAIPAAPDLNEDTLIETAFKQRPEYAQADINILKADRNIRLARRGLEPFVTVGASGQYNPEPAIASQEKATGSVNLTLTVPINDGGSTKAQVEAARSDQRGALIQKDQFTRGIKSEVQQAIVAVRDAAERIRASELSVTQANEALRLAGVRFQAGVGTQLDVNDAQTAAVQAATNAVNARYDYLGALARLDRAVGKPL